MNKIISPFELPLICGFLQLRHRDRMLFLLFLQETFSWLYLDDVSRDIYMRRNEKVTKLRRPLNTETMEERI